MSALLPLASNHARKSVSSRQMLGSASRAYHTSGSIHLASSASPASRRMSAGVRG
jgi:hypothetical protein